MVFKSEKSYSSLNLRKKEKQKLYKGNYADVSSNCGVMCTWYINKEGANKFEILPLETSYYHIGKYVCTLTEACFTNSLDSTRNLTAELGSFPLNPIVDKLAKFLN